MKGIIFGYLLFIISHVLAVNDSVSDTNIGGSSDTPSEACMAEMNKYANCLTSPNLDSNTNIQQYCNRVESDNCKTFKEDITKIDLDCLSGGSENINDTVSGAIILISKMVYLLGCSKGNDDEYCPLSTYLQEHASTTINELTPELLRAAVQDGKDSKCNERFLLTNEIDVFVGNNTEKRQSSSDAAYLVDYYLNGNCDEILDIPINYSDFSSDDSN